jgi:hypothetical protein
MQELAVVFVAITEQFDLPSGERAREVNCNVVLPE